MVVKEEIYNDSTLMNFIKNTTKEYSKEQLTGIYEDEEETTLYLDLLDPDLIKESTSSNVILESNDDKRRK